MCNARQDRNDGYTSTYPSHLIIPKLLTNLKEFGDQMAHPTILGPF